MSVNNNIHWSELVSAAKNNDSEAIEKLYNDTYVQAFSVAMQMVKNEQDAMDILQDSYVSAFKNLNGLKDPEKFKSWFNCIVANRCRDFLRKNKAIPFTDLDVAEDTEFEDTLENDKIEFSPDESVDYSETKRIVNEILQALPEEQKLCILMYYYNELTIKEIAETLECSESTVKSRLNYAKKKIKEDVKTLENKGTFLLGGAVVPFVVWMLKGMEANVTVTTVAPQIYAAVQGGAIVGSTMAGSAVGTSTAVGTTATTTGVAGTTAATTGTVAAGIGATKIGVVVAGVAAAAAISVGAAVGVSNHNQNNETQPVTNVVVEQDLSTGAEENSEGYKMYVCEKTTFGEDVGFYLSVSEDKTYITLIESNNLFELVLFQTETNENNTIEYEAYIDDKIFYNKLKELERTELVEPFLYYEDQRNWATGARITIVLNEERGELEFSGDLTYEYLNGKYYRDDNFIVQDDVHSTILLKKFVCAETEIGTDTTLYVEIEYDGQVIHLVDNELLIDIMLPRVEECFWGAMSDEHQHSSDSIIYESWEQGLLMHYKIKDFNEALAQRYSHVEGQTENELEDCYVEVSLFLEDGYLEYFGVGPYEFHNGTYYLAE